MAEQTTTPEERFARLKAEVDQLKAEVNQLKAQMEHMCGDSQDLAKARQFVLHQVMVLGKSWVDTHALLMARGSAASKLLAEKVNDRVRPHYKAGGRPDRYDIFQLLNDSAFMALLRYDYLQKGRKITGSPPAE